MTNPEAVSDFSNFQTVPAANKFLRNTVHSARSLVKDGKSIINEGKDLNRQLMAFNSQISSVQLTTNEDNLGLAVAESSNILMTYGSICSLPVIKTFEHISSSNLPDLAAYTAMLAITLAFIYGGKKNFKLCFSDSSYYLQL